MNKQEQAYQKVLKVIKSCRTIDQCNVAFNMVAFFVKKYPKADTHEMTETYLQQRQKIVFVFQKDVDSNM